MVDSDPLSGVLGIDPVKNAVDRFRSNWHVDRCLEVEVTSQGEAFDDTLANLREALELYLEDQPFPEGTEAPIIAPVDIPA